MAKPHRGENTIAPGFNPGKIKRKRTVLAEFFANAKILTKQEMGQKYY